MSHEPECHCHNLDDYLESLPKSERPRCTCTALRAAYGRGFKDGHERSSEAYDAGYVAGQQHGYDEGRTFGYREGYNAHARSRAYAEAVYGPYKQHGQGENP